MTYPPKFISRLSVLRRRGRIAEALALARIEWSDSYVVLSEYETAMYDFSERVNCQMRVIGESLGAALAKFADALFMAE